MFRGWLTMPGSACSLQKAAVLPGKLNAGNSLQPSCWHLLSHVLTYMHICESENRHSASRSHDSSGQTSEGSTMSASL